MRTIVAAVWLVLLVAPCGCASNIQEPAPLPLVGAGSMSCEELHAKAMGLTALWQRNNLAAQGFAPTAQDLFVPYSSMRNGHVGKEINDQMLQLDAAFAANGCGTYASEEKRG